ncbi:MAG TPA: hypothetical protein VMD74_00580 [Candidatus Methylomirabilis sp.]|nr:hypothetical protein [Candidatus Methylomirabilis sp.]
MTLKSYLLLMIFTTLVCWGILVGVVTMVDPTATNWPGFVLFYVSLFLALVGTTALIGFLFRFVFLKQTLAFRAVTEAFRQSFLFAFLIIAALFLLSRHLFSWINIALLVAALALIEFFLIAYERSKMMRGK